MAATAGKLLGSTARYPEASRCPLNCGADQTTRRESLASSTASPALMRHSSTPGASTYWSAMDSRRILGSSRLSRSFCGYALSSSTHVSFEYQFIANPADGGPDNIFSGSFHWQFCRCGKHHPKQDSAIAEKEIRRGTYNPSNIVCRPWQPPYSRRLQPRPRRTMSGSQLCKMTCKSFCTLCSASRWRRCRRGRRWVEMSFTLESACTQQRT
jgi:hypothetical protein